MKVFSASCRRCFSSSLSFLGFGGADDGTGNRAAGVGVAEGASWSGSADLIGLAGPSGGLGGDEAGRNGLCRAGAIGDAAVVPAPSASPSDSVALASSSSPDLDFLGEIRGGGDGSIGEGAFSIWGAAFSTRGLGILDEAYLHWCWFRSI